MLTTLDQLVDMLKRLERPKGFILACGCFDVLTIGHVRHLQAARQLGNFLCVLVTTDCYVGKGAGRPVFPEADRMEVINALKCVNAVLVNPHATAVEAIERLRPDIYVKGREYKDHLTPALAQEVETLLSVGGKLEFTDGEESHTTDVLRRLGVCA